MFSWIEGKSSFTDGILRERSRFGGGASDRCVTASCSGEVGGVGTCEVGAARHVAFEEARNGEGGDKPGGWGR